MGETEELRLGVNIDHVATVRNARGGAHPDPVRAALLAEQAGADGITAHLREDRRHIRDADIADIKAALSIPLNFEMAATEDMVAIALETRPHAACIVPERREEVTTEGGLAVAGRENELIWHLAVIKEAGIRLSLFIEPNPEEIRAAATVGADIIELHVGRYCGDEAGRPAELVRIQQAAALAEDLGIECHAGHGLDYDTVGAIAAIPQMRELNIGHFLMGESMFVGMPAALAEMRRLMIQARSAT
jgi:pyridoxine 5-phosphate synthase